MLAERTVRQLLMPFVVDLTAPQFERVQAYLELLLRWNQKINLTSIRNPQECVTRHFGESFFLAGVLPVAGKLLDVGSGAGFPGLALKIIQPELGAILLEPVGKKRAFLKEVIRVCRFEQVEVSGLTLEQFSRGHEGSPMDLVTMRAVGKLRALLPQAVNCLRTGGHLCLWLGREQAKEVMGREERVEWAPAIPLPLSQRRQLLIGKRADIS